MILTKPEKFRAFFKEQLVLVGLEKYTYEEGETLCADVQVANYGKTDCAGDLEWTLWAYMPDESLGEENSDEISSDEAKLNVRKIAVKSGRMSAVLCPKGTLSKAGTLKIELNHKNYSTSSL